MSLHFKTANEVFNDITGRSSEASYGLLYMRGTI
jgi:hypothetical protein